MQDSTEALERIDSSFQFMLVAKGLDSSERQSLEAKARKAYETNWRLYDAAVDKENGNITIHPTEDELAKRLEELTRRYRSRGDAFYQSTMHGPVKHRDYYSESGLYDTFVQIKGNVSSVPWRTSSRTIT